VVWYGYWASGNGYEILYWDGTTIIQITDNTYSDKYPEINNNGEVVLYGHDGSDYEIFYYDGNNAETAWNTISNNNITSNTNSGIHLNYCYYNTIVNNHLSLNGYGIFFNHCRYNTMINNEVESNGNGICHYYTSNYNTINENLIQLNTLYGVIIYDTCIENLIYHNNFIDNSNQAYDVSGSYLWNNVYPVGGNYWSDYIGVDHNSTPAQNVPPSDGFGDTARSSLGAVDLYPLMQPYGSLDNLPPTHSLEYPQDNSTIINATPIISVCTVDVAGIDTSTIRLYVNSIAVFYQLTPVVNGYNVSYWHERGFSGQEIVTCRIVAQDNQGNELDYTWSFSIVEKNGPDHSNEFPPVDSSTTYPWPTVSVHVTDPSGVDSSSIRLYVEGFSVFYNLTPITDGYNVSYYYSAGFSPGEVTCRIVADDVYGNGLDFSWKFTVIPSIDVPLVAGWNLVSIPLIQSDTSILSFLSSINGKWDLAQTYSQGQWKSYATYQPPSLNDLQDLDHTMAVWLHTTEACTLNVTGTVPTSTDIQLYSGWNLVGYPSYTQRSIMTALAGTGYDRPIEGHDPGNPYHLTQLPALYLMQPGEGYWIHVPADTVWIIDW